MIGVIDYRAGNAAGVLYAMERLGIAAEAVHTAEELEKVSGADPFRNGVSGCGHNLVGV